MMIGEKEKMKSVTQRCLGVSEPMGHMGHTGHMGHVEQLQQGETAK